MALAAPLGRSLAVSAAERNPEERATEKEKTIAPQPGHSGVLINNRWGCGAFAGVTNNVLLMAHNNLRSGLCIHTWLLVLRLSLWGLLVHLWLLTGLLVHLWLLTGSI